MSENKSTPPATSCTIPVVSQPVSMIAVSSSGPPTSLTPTSNVTITTTAAMTHPHPPPTPQAMSHPGVPQSPIPQCNIWMMDDQTNLSKTGQYNNQRVQVIQQAPGGGYTPYLQHLYNTPQQLLMSAAGNITLQPTTMSPSIQVRMWHPHLEHGDQRDQPFNAFSTPMLGLPIHMGKASGLEQKPNPVAMKPMLMPSTSMAATSMSSAARAGSILAPSSIMTANRQITPQMLAASKPLLQGQNNYMASNANQTLLIGQLGVLSSQPSLIPTHTKAVGDAQRAKPFVMGQTATLQPKSPILPHPQAGGGPSGPAVSGTATVLSTSQFKQMSQGATLVSTPQLMTSQAAMLASQAQILNPALHAIGPNYQGITWTTTGGIQSPALLATAQNPIFIRGGQQQDMFLQSPPPQPPPAIQPAPAAQMPKPKQVKHRTKAHANRNAQAPGTTVQSQKADAANQTKLMGPPVQQSTASQTSQTKTQTEPARQQQPIQKVTASVETQANSPLAAKSPVTPPSKPAQEEEPMDTTSSDPPPAETPMEVATQASSTKEDEVKEAPMEEPAPPVSSTVLTTTSTTTPTTTTVAAVTATVAPDVAKEKQLPQKAIVKPHILTHVIEGYVIQEGPEPFPVNRSSLITDFNSQKQSPQVEKEIEEDGMQKKREKADSELAKCEFCGKIAARRKFRRSKRFCSTSCAKRYNVGCSKRIAMFAGPLGPGDTPVPVDVEEPVVHKSRKRHMKRKGWRKSAQGRPPNVHAEEEWQNGGESSQKEETTTDSHSGAESSLSPTTPTSHKDMDVDHADAAPEPQSAPEPAISKNPMKWSVQDVYDFVRALPGCSDYADEFRMQEIDGQALMLLKEDHLMTAMSMKLGPALKICARINTLRDEVSRH